MENRTILVLVVLGVILVLGIVLAVGFTQGWFGKDEEVADASNNDVLTALNRVADTVDDANEKADQAVFTADGAKDASDSNALQLFTLQEDVTSAQTDATQALADAASALILGSKVAHARVLVDSANTASNGLIFNVQEDITNDLTLIRPADGRVFIPDGARYRVTYSVLTGTGSIKAKINSTGADWATLPDVDLAASPSTVFFTEADLPNASKIYFFQFTGTGTGEITISRLG